MDNHIRDFFSQSGHTISGGNFHKVIPLHESPQLDWDSVSKLIPDLCKGWYELACLPTKDRIEFVQDHWLAKLPYHPRLNEFLSTFFKELDDIGIFLFQQKFDDPFHANMVYSIKKNGGFFRGAIPATEAEITQLRSDLSVCILPDDYLSFLRLHNGFAKTTDSTGITPTHLMVGNYKKFQDTAEQETEITTTKGIPVNPKGLIPFYESFGMPFFQCFWTEWYPDHEMGNVYYSGAAKTISDVSSTDSSFANMAFPTFIDWLIFYMERVD